MIETLFDFVADFLMMGSPNGKARWFWGILWIVLIGGGIALTLLWA